MTELQLINDLLRYMARHREHNPSLIQELQIRRMEIIAGPDWQANLNAWVRTAQELR